MTDWYISLHHRLLPSIDHNQGKTTGCVPCYSPEASKVDCSRAIRLRLTLGTLASDAPFGARIEELCPAVRDHYVLGWSR